MSLKKVEQVKDEKPFRLADLIIYGVIAAVAAVLFIVLFAVEKNGAPLDGVRVYVRDEIVFEYGFDGSGYKILSDCAEVDDGEKLKVKITVDGGYNLIEIDKYARSVSVTESDCRTHDCVYSKAITDGNSVIICLPHHLRIEPYGYKNDGRTVIIG